MEIRFQKPTAAEARAYDSHEPPPCFPLYRWVWLEDPNCATQRIRLSVENCAGNYAGPRVEVIAPDGWQFEGLHSLLAHSLRELRDLLQVTKLERCPIGCDCEWEERRDEN